MSEDGDMAHTNQKIQWSHLQKKYKILTSKYTNLMQQKVKKSDVDQKSICSGRLFSYGTRTEVSTLM